MRAKILANAQAIQQRLGGQPLETDIEHKDGKIVDRDGKTIGIVSATVGTSGKNGNVVDLFGKIIGKVSEPTGDNVPVIVAGPVKTPDGNSIANEYFYIKDGNEHSTVKSVRINEQGMLEINETRGENYLLVIWQPTPDTCNLDKVRLVHLDGSKLEEEEYDRIQRFIRLWHKMGWTIDETDKALIGLDRLTAVDGTSPKSDKECDYVGFEVFEDDCSKTSSDNNGDCNKPTDDFDCPDLVEITAEITPHFLHQLVAVKKLLDKTGLELAKLLTFWANISTNGEKFLYKRLFLTHNLLGIDKVFKPDRNGNYLTESAKISEHLPVLMAALRLKADDITAIAKFRQLKDDLTLANVSVLYRHSLLAKVLSIKVTELFEAIELFGDPFKNAHETLKMLKNWGKMEDAGFSFRQLNYIIRDRDDALHPVAPKQKTILQITKTLYDGLNKIEQDHESITEDNQQHFILFLRQQLSHRLIVETLSGVASLPTDETNLLLTEVLTIGEPKQPAISALQKIKETPENLSGWQGYLIPAVDDSYTFIAKSDTQPASLMLDGQSVSFPDRQEDLSDVLDFWLSDPVNLKAGKLYYLVVSDRTGSQLQWKTATSPKAQIPASALLPDYSKQGTEEIFTKLYKAALLVNGFNLSTDEISYWQNNPADFDNFNFNQITLDHWKRLQAYTTLRNSLPRTETNLLDLFNWAKTAENSTELSQEIAAATVWKKENIEKLIHEEHFDLIPIRVLKCNFQNLSESEIAYLSE